MSQKENDEVATLTAYMPWLKREEALELLKNYGGDAESVMRILEEASNMQTESQPPTGEKKPKATGKNVDKKKAEKHFVGGGPSSGQVVLGGDEGEDVENVIESVFSKARENPAAAEGNAEAQFFFGRGRRLGHTTSASPFLESTLRQQRDIVVTVFRDSYRVDDGPTVRKSSPEGMAFFKALEAGVVPKSIAAMYPNTGISVRLVDCSQQEAVTSFAPFAGEGHRLAAEKPKETPTAAAAVSSSSQSGVNSTPVAMSSEFELHEDEEVAKLAIVNLLGERKEFRVNPQRHTVSDVFFLAAHHAQPGAISFQLIARDVPPRPLTDGSLTIDAAKLRNATVLMRRR